MQTRLSCFSDAESLVDNRDQPFEIKTEADSNDIADDKSRPYLCTVCDKRFTTIDNLNYHKRMHSAVKRDDMYSCTQCEKRYSSQHALSVHMNIHSGRYKCRECGRWCASRGDLAVHNQFSCSLNDARNAPTTNINIMLR